MLVGLMIVVQVDQFSLFGHSITNLAKDALYLLISGIEITPSLDHGHPDGYCGWVHCSQMQVL